MSALELTVKISPGELLWHLHAIATADATCLVQTADGELVIGNTDTLTDAQRAAICSLEKSGGCLKVKLYDKLKALELLGKYMGLFERGVSGEAGESPLLQAVLSATGEVMDTHDLPEVQQAAAAGDDLVEQTGLEGL